MKHSGALTSEEKRKIIFYSLLIKAKFVFLRVQGKRVIDDISIVDGRVDDAFITGQGCATFVRVTGYLSSGFSSVFDGKTNLDHSINIYNKSL